MSSCTDIPFNSLDGAQLDETLANYASQSSPESAEARAAILSKNEEKLETALENSNAWISREGSGLIHLAVKDKSFECLKYLLIDFKLSPDGTNANNLTPLFVAVSEGWLEGVKLLLEANADIENAYGVDKQIVRGKVKPEAASTEKSTQHQKFRKTAPEISSGMKTILQHAVNNDNVDILRAILASARSRDNYKEIVNVLHSRTQMTPLLMAVTKNKLSFVVALLENGADVNLHDKDGHSVLQWAVEKKATNIIEKLFEVYPEEILCLSGKKCKGNFKGTPLSFAINGGDLKSVRFLVETVKASVLEKSSRSGYANGFEMSLDDENYNVLHLASMSDSKKIIHYVGELLRNHDNSLWKLVNETTRNGCSPLSFAFQKQQFKFASLLVEFGGDLSAQGQAGKTNMEVMINYLPIPVKFLTNALDRSLMKDKKKPRYVIDYTVFHPTGCCGGSSKNTSRKEGPCGEDKPEELPKGGRQGGEKPEGELQKEEESQKGGESQKEGELPNGGPQGKELTVGETQEEEPLMGVTSNQPLTIVQDSRPPNNFHVMNEMVKIGITLDDTRFFNHAVVEAYLHRNWLTIRGPFAIILILSAMYATFLSVAAALASANDLVYAQNESSVVYFDTNKPPGFNVLNVFVCVFMILLFIYEIECFHTRVRPPIYWAETVLKLVCFCLTISWLATGLRLHLTIAILLAWLQVSVLILKVRQCHSYGRRLLHFLKKLYEHKEVIFGLIGTVLSVSIISGGGSPIVSINGMDKEMDNLWYDVIFSLAILSSCLSLIFFLLVLCYTMITYNDNYVPPGTVDLVLHQIEFLSVYEQFLLGKKPRYLAIGQQGIICYAYKRIAFAIQFLESLLCQNKEMKESSKLFIRKCLPYCNAAKKSNATVVFPDDIQRAILKKATESRERLKAYLKEKEVFANKQKEASEDKQRDILLSQEVLTISDLMTKIATKLQVK